MRIANRSRRTGGRRGVPLPPNPGLTLPDGTRPSFEGVPPACAWQCPGRLRFVGYLDDEAGPIALLVRKWKVALPLHAEYGTEPNVFYVPPILPPAFDAEGRISQAPRVPTEYLRSLFGPGVDEALRTLEAEIGRKQRGEASELMDLLIAKDWKSLFRIEDLRLA